MRIVCVGLQPLRRSCMALGTRVRGGDSAKPCGPAGEQQHGTGAAAADADTNSTTCSCCCLCWHNGRMELMLLGAAANGAGNMRALVPDAGRMHVR